MPDFFLCPDALEAAGNDPKFCQEVLFGIASGTQDGFFCIDEDEWLREHYLKQAKSVYDPRNVLVTILPLLCNVMRKRKAKYCGQSFPELGIDVLSASLANERFAIVEDENAYGEARSVKKVNGIKITGRRKITRAFEQNKSLSFEFEEFNRLVRRSLCNLPESYDKNTSEDDLNLRVAQDIRVAGYSVDEKATGGRSGGGKTKGERDFLVYDDGAPISLIEGVRVKKVTSEKANLKKHIDKAYDRYNRLGLKQVYQFVYYNGKDFSQCFEDYCDFLVTNYTMCNNAFCQSLVAPYGVLETVDSSHDEICMTHFFCDVSGEPLVG